MRLLNETNIAATTQSANGQLFVVNLSRRGWFELANIQKIFKNDLFDAILENNQEDAVFLISKIIGINQYFGNYVCVFNMI